MSRVRPQQGAWCEKDGKARRGLRQAGGRAGNALEDGVLRVESSLVLGSISYQPLLSCPCVPPAPHVTRQLQSETPPHTHTLSPCPCPCPSLVTRQLRRETDRHTQSTLSHSNTHTHATHQLRRRTRRLQHEICNTSFARTCSPGSSGTCQRACVQHAACMRACINICERTESLSPALKLSLPTRCGSSSCLCICVCVSLSVSCVCRSLSVSVCVCLCLASVCCLCVCLGLGLSLGLGLGLGLCLALFVCVCACVTVESDI